MNTDMETKRRVLVLYVYDNHHELIETTVDLVRAKGFIVDAICVSSYRCYKKSTIFWPRVIYMANFLVHTLRFPKARGFFSNFLGNRLFPTIIDQYDIIDFQAFPSSQYQLAEYCISTEKEYVIDFWGSDVLRASDDDFIKMKKSLDYAKKILLNKSMRQRLNTFLKEKFDVDYDSKYTGSVDGITNGNKDLFLLDSLTEQDREESVSLFNKGNENKLIITIGYNGSSMQYHEKIINELLKLPTKLKESIHLVLPMTYGCTADYREEIRSNLFESGLSYTILDVFLTNKEVCVLRKVTDVFVMLQKTDGFAGSVRSHLYCQNVCLIADWLDYPIDNNGVYYLKVNWNNLIENLTEVVLHYEDYHAKCLGNKEKMYSYMSWDRYVDMLCEIYKQ